MMQRAICTLIGVIALSSQSAFGAIVNVDFESQPYLNFFSSVSDSGFNFTSLDPDNSPYAIAIADPDFFGPIGPDNGSQRYLFSNDANHVISVQHAGGAAFSLLSFDFAEAHQGITVFWATTITVTGFLSGGGTVTATAIPDFVHDGPGGVADFQTLVLPASFTNLVEVQFAGAGALDLNFYNLDNLKIETAPAEVPEPASLVLLSLGGIGLVAARRKQLAA